MKEPEMTVALLRDGKMYKQQSDGTFTPEVGKKNWEKLAKMTEEEIENAALSDEENPPITDEQFAQALIRTK